MSNSILTVTQVNSYVKALLDDNVHLKNLYVVGEISNFHHHIRSGHMYITLKDENCRLKAVMYKSAAQRLRFMPEDGMRVVCRGRISVYLSDGAYQFYIDDMQPDGVGALAVAFEQLKLRLEEAGMFDPEHKKQIPPFPSKIGVATSDVGAAVRDIINVTGRRCPMTEIAVMPTAVQGAQAAGDIADSIRRLDSMPDVDLIIVGRGGGSIEDLWAFNTEDVATAVYNCRTPIISAVGHETDFTICDFVADLRAPTPSAAAELAVPDLSAYADFVHTSKSRMSLALQNRIDSEKQRLDGICESTVLFNSGDYFAALNDEISVLNARLTDAYKYNLERQSNALYSLAARLDALSPLKVMARGYCAVQKGGKAVTAVDLNINDIINLTFNNGAASCTVNEVNKNG